MACAGPTVSWFFLYKIYKHTFKICCLGHLRQIILSWEISEINFEITDL